MTAQILKNLGPLALAAALSLAPAYAANVSYSTTGTFSSCSGYFTCSGGSVITGASSFKIAYTPVTSVLPANITAPPPSYAQFGLFTVTGGSKNNTTSGAATFTLNITQVVPTPGGTQTFADKIAGVVKTTSTGKLQIDFTSGTGTAPVSVSTDPLTFNPTPALTFTLGYATYWVDESTPFVPSAAGSSSSINGAIDAPEPSLYLLTSVGFAALLIAFRRKKQPVA